MRYSDDEYDICSGAAIYEDDGNDGQETEFSDDSDDNNGGYYDRLQYHIDEYYSRGYGGEEWNLQDPPEEWRYLRLGDALLQVSDKGKIRCPRTHAVSYGFAVLGTPYRTYPVFLEKEKPPTHIYIHELVWRAFEGVIKPGYEVRHNMWVPKSGAEKYPNDLKSLEIYKKPEQIWKEDTQCDPSKLGYSKDILRM